MDIDIGLMAAAAACQAEHKAMAAAKRGLGAFTPPAREYNAHAVREALVLILLQTERALHADDFTWHTFEAEIDSWATRYH